jgi:hypothetical protein
VPTDEPHGRFVDGVRRDAIGDAPPGAVATDYAVLDALRAQGRSFEDAADIERDLALVAAWRDPVDFAEGGWLNVRAMFDGLSELEGPRAVLDAELEQQDHAALGWLGRRLWWLGGILSDVWIRLAGFGLLLLLLPFMPAGRARVAGVVVLSVWLLNAFATGFTTWVTLGDARFAAQGAPLAALGGSAAIVFVAGAVASRLRRGEAPAQADRTAAG